MAASAVPAEIVAMTAKISEGVVSFDFDISVFSLGERDPRLSETNSTRCNLLQLLCDFFVAD
jgi:hypothetical protein